MFSLSYLIYEIISGFFLFYRFSIIGKGITNANNWFNSTFPFPNVLESLHCALSVSLCALCGSVARISNLVTAFWGLKPFLFLRCGCVLGWWRFSFYLFVFSFRICKSLGGICTVRVDFVREFLWDESTSCMGLWVKNVGYWNAWMFCLHKIL